MKESKRKSKEHIVTVLLHDYFHRGVFKEIIGEKQWNRFESRLDKNIDNVLELFDPYKIKATFFTLGWIAEKNPKIIERISKERHEIASAGLWPRCIEEMSPETFREDISRSKVILEAASNQKVIGYRCAYKWISKKYSWAFNILKEQGYLYDASVKPKIITIKKENIRFMHKIETNTGPIWEFPTSTFHLAGLNIPISGGAYLRLFPERFLESGFRSWCRNYNAPFILYFHPWELDIDVPRITAINPILRFKQYGNIGKLKKLLPRYFDECYFQSISKYLKLESKLESNSTKIKKIKKEKIGGQIKIQAEGIRKVSIVIPCFNEKSSLPYLKRTMDELVRENRNNYHFKFIFVDDCSTDGTYEALNDLYQDDKNCLILKHSKNKGIAASISTGIKNAETEIVASIDADCSYDPFELVKMIPLLDNQTDMVTASPYHKDGFVLNVPKWRLFLSKSLSKIYNQMLKIKLSTYTSCFRIYRRNSMENMELKYNDFRGIAEQIILLEKQGGSIKEYPTTLQSRIFGFSSMKIFKTILGHIQLILSLIIDNKT